MRWTRPSRNGRGARTRRGSRGGWETLGLGLLRHEVLEQRTPLAANVVLSLTDDVVAGVARSFYSPGSQVTYTLTVENLGDQTANDVQLSTTLDSDITKASWNAAYTGVGNALPLGTGDISLKLSLPALAKATFTIVGTVRPEATGDLETSAKIVVDSKTTTTTDVDAFVPRWIVASDDAGVTSTSAVRLLDPQTGGEIARVNAFEPTLRTGVRTAVGDLDADGKDEVVAVAGYAHAADVVILRAVQAGGAWRLEKAATVAAVFGSAYRRGLNVAVGNFAGDGRNDIAVGQASGPGGVKILESGPGLAFAAARSFIPVAGNRFGVTLAAGDFGTFPASGPTDPTRPDGRDELVVVAATASGSVARIHNVAAPSAPVLDTVRPFAADASLRGGATVTTARVNKDTISDLIFAQGRGGQSLLQVFDGTIDATKANAVIAAVTAFPAAARPNAPVVVAAIDTDGDGRANRLDAVQAGAGRADLQRFAVTDAAVGAAISLTPVPNAMVAAMAVRQLSASLPRPNDDVVSTASGLKFRDLEIGTGAKPSSPDALVIVKYEGRLLNGTVFETGTIRDPLDPNKGSPLSNYIGGWKEGIRTMRVGGRRQLIIPPGLAYGAAGSPPKIPGDATLVFTVELISTT